MPTRTALSTLLIALGLAACTEPTATTAATPGAPAQSRPDTAMGAGDAASAPGQDAPALGDLAGAPDAPRADAPVAAGSGTANAPPTDASTSAEAPPADAAAPAAFDGPRIPARFHGSYAREGACARAGDELRLVVEADRLRFHEATGTVLHAAGEADTIRIRLRLTGEGETREAVHAFRREAGGMRLVDMDGGLVRVRCPRAPAEPPAF